MQHRVLVRLVWCDRYPVAVVQYTFTHKQYTERIQIKQYIEQHNNFGECGPCPVLASYTLAFALQLRKKHGKTSVRVGATASGRTNPD